MAAMIQKRRSNSNLVARTGGDRTRNDAGVASDKINEADYPAENFERFWVASAYKLRPNRALVSMC
jgi:hypothetical protein